MSRITRNKLPRTRSRFSRRGFTVAEVVVALVILATGLLGLAGGTSLAVRMAGNAGRTSAAVAFAQQRLEVIRARACTVRNGGSESLTRGGSTIAETSWKFFDDGNSTYSVVLETTYRVGGGQEQGFTIEESFTCLP